MTIQKTEWGQIEWYEYTRGEAGQTPGMNVGIVTVEPGAYEPKHVHYEEQMLYVLEGEAEGYVDGVYQRMTPGNLYHWPAGVTDELRNVGRVPFRHLLASQPMHLDEKMLLEKKEEPGEELLSREEKVQLLYIAVESIRTQFLERLHYAYAIFDCTGTPVLKSQYFPTHCLQCCSPSLLFGASRCMIAKGEDFREEGRETCRYGMQVLWMPIYYRGQFIGHMKGGFIRSSEKKGQQVYNVYDMPKSNVQAIRSLMKKIVGAIENYCEFEHFRKEMARRDLELAHTIEAQQMMEKSLKQAEYLAADLRINNHFLFNTLNSMASMALDGGNVALYQSIINLSRMFHYTLHLESPMVPLRREAAYLKAYLDLQAIRYQDGLQVCCTVDPEAEGLLVPHNFLQPIVENAFVHGFGADPVKKIWIEIQRNGERIGIRLGNSGKMLGEQECRAVLIGMKSQTSHGLSMIYSKLFSLYGQDFTIEITSEEKKGTEFYLEIPVKGEEDSYDPDSYL